MAGPDTEEEEEPSERGSDAVDRRIEKIMSDLREQNLVDINDEKAYEAKKVSYLTFGLVGRSTDSSLNRRPWRSICISLTFELPSTRASTAVL
jgi:hypothetical protein